MSHYDFNAELDRAFDRMRQTAGEWIPEVIIPESTDAPRIALISPDESVSFAGSIPVERISKEEFSGMWPEGSQLGPMSRPDLK